MQYFRRAGARRANKDCGINRYHGNSMFGFHVHQEPSVPLGPSAWPVYTIDTLSVCAKDAN